MYQRLQCEACCRVFDHRDEAESDTTIWCPHCGARYIPPKERYGMMKLAEARRTAALAKRPPYEDTSDKADIKPPSLE